VTGAIRSWRAPTASPLALLELPYRLFNDPSSLERRAHLQRSRAQLHGRVIAQGPQHRPALGLGEPHEARQCRVEERRLVAGESLPQHGFRVGGARKDQRFDDHIPDLHRQGQRTLQRARAEFPNARRLPVCVFAVRASRQPERSRGRAVPRRTPYPPPTEMPCRARRYSRRSWTCSTAWSAPLRG